MLTRSGWSLEREENLQVTMTRQTPTTALIAWAGVLILGIVGFFAVKLGDRMTSKNDVLRLQMGKGKAKVNFNGEAKVISGQKELKPYANRRGGIDGLLLFVAAFSSLFGWVFLLAAG